jgi:uncharacterized protein (DUF1015 family)
MPILQPFRGWQYDLGRVGALSDVVAPPYDVIDSELQNKLYSRHANNVIRLELNKAEAGDTDQSKYQRAARLLKDWQQEGVLRAATTPALYVYHQKYTVDGQTHIRKGVLARVRLERFGEGTVYPHEETLPGPKKDRLSLMHATAMNISPVFGLYPDQNNTVQQKLDAAISRTPPVEATDHLGVVNHLWTVTDQHLLAEVQSLMHPKPVFIADGHHRYETALKYRDERRAKGEDLSEDAASNFILMMMVSMSDPGLLILPTYRLISGLAMISAPQLRYVLEPHFEVETVGQGEDGMRDCWDLVAADEQNLLGFGTVADNTWLTARLRDHALMDQLAADHSPAWRSLAVSRLHVILLDKLLNEKLPPQPGKPVCQYVHTLAEVNHFMNHHEGQFTALVPPATMEHVAEIARSLEKMPPKSTYFYPKLLTGLVFHSLR